MHRKATTNLEPIPRGTPAFAKTQRSEILEMLRAAGPGGVSRAKLIFERRMTQCGAGIFELEQRGFEIRHDSRPGERYVNPYLLNASSRARPIDQKDLPAICRCFPGCASEQVKRLSPTPARALGTHPRWTHVGHGGLSFHLHLQRSRHSHGYLEGLGQVAIWRVGDTRKNGAGCTRKDGARRLHPAICRARKAFLLPDFGSQIPGGEHNGEQLNAIDSKTPVDLAYFPREQSVEDSVKHGVEHSAAQKRKRIEKETEKKASAPKPTAQADPRHKAVFESCFEAYRVRFGVVPTWGGREGKTLQRFLQEHPSISAEGIAVRYGHLLASTDRYHAEKHGSFVHLLSSFDVFADGPVEKSFSVKEGGLNRAEERERNNLKAARLLQ